MLLVGVNIEMLLIGLICFIMLISLIVGVIQGFRKNIFNFIATILFWILFWLTAPLVKGNLFWYNESFYQLIDSILPELSSNINCVNLMDYIKYTIAESAGIDVSLLSDPSVENTFIAIAQCIIKFGYLIVLAIFYGIIKLILYHTIFKKYCKISNKSLNKLKKKQEKYLLVHKETNKKLEKQIEHTEKAVKNNKIFTPLGLLSGFLRGAFTSFLILCVVNATVKLIPQDSNEKMTASTGETTSSPSSLYDFILLYCEDNPNVKTAIEWIHEYQSSSLMNVTGIKIGNQAADELFVDSILSGKSKDYSFALRKELSAFVQIAENAFYLTNGFDMESVNWTSLNNAQVNNVQQILRILSNDDLLNNLGSVMVGVAISLDAVAEYIPSNLSANEYADIHWGDELATIADLVAQVYSLGDLSSLDYFDLDAQVIENIMVTLSNLKSINFLGHIGCNLAIKSLVKDDGTYQKTIQSIENKLALLSSNGDYASAIYSYKDLYTQFINIFEDETLSNYKDENGKITNYVSALTSVDTKEYSNIIHTVFETNFVSEILPDVLTIIKGSYIPQEYASLINPKVVTSQQWENEIDAVLTILHDITIEKETGIIHPFETIQTYDFSLLRNFTPETVIESDLLSYALIKIFIDTSKSEGILSNISGELANYICIPDFLATAEDTVTHRFHSKWYGTPTEQYHDGELYILLNTVKNCASQLKDLNYPAESIPAILAALNSNELMNSDALYYTLNNLIKDYQDFIIVPVDETTESDQTVNGQKIQFMIKRESLKQMISIFSDSNIVDLEKLFVYFERIDDKNCSDVPTAIEDIQNMDDYIVKLDIAPEKIMSLLTSEKLYNPTTGDETNLNKLFASGILRATLTKLILDNAGEYIALPESVKDSLRPCLVLKTDETNQKKELVEESFDIIKQSQFKSLIIAVDDLKIDLNKVLNQPMDVIEYLKDGDDIKESVNSVFGVNGYANSKYSGILHGTLSKYILDFSSSENGGIQIIIPEEVIDSSDATLNLIESQETVNLIRSVTIIGVDIFNESMTDNELMNSIIDRVLENNQSLDSVIIRATLSNYIHDSEQEIEIPQEANDSSIQSKNVVSKNHLVDFLEALKIIKEVRNEELSLNQEPLIDYADLLDINNLKLSTLKNADSLPGNPISQSLIVRGIITKQLTDFDVSIPSEAKEGSCLSKNETHLLFKALSSLLDENSSITNIEVNNCLDTLTVHDLYEIKEDIHSSIVIRNIITDEILKQDEIKMPSSAITSSNIIKEEELDNLIDGLNQLLKEDDTITSMDIQSITTSKLKNATSYIIQSSILNATITNQILKQSEITIPDHAYDSENFDTFNPTLNGAEINACIEAIAQLFPNGSINNLPIENLTLTTLNDHCSVIVNSLIFKATITTKLNEKQDEDILIIPSIALDEHEIIKNDEIIEIMGTLSSLLGDNTLTNITDLSEITISSLHMKKDSIVSSYVLRATLSKKIFDVEDMKILNRDIDPTIIDCVVLKEESMSQLLDALNCMNIQDIQNINMDMLSVKSESKEIIASSDIIRATITHNVNIEIDNEMIDKRILKENAEICKDYLGNEIIVINEEELKNIIDSINVLSKEGTMTIQFDIFVLLNLNSNELATLLNSNSLRIAIADYFIKGFKVNEMSFQYENIMIPYAYGNKVGDYILQDCGSYYKFADPHFETIYNLPNIEETEYLVLTSEDIMAVLNYINSII